MARTLNNKPVLIPNLWFQPYSSNLFKMDAFLFFTTAYKQLLTAFQATKHPWWDPYIDSKLSSYLAVKAASHKVKAPSILRKCPDSFAHFLLAWILWISANQITGNWLNDQLQAWIFKAFPRPYDVTQVVFSQYEIQDFTLSPITDDLSWIVELVKRLPAFGKPSQNLYKDPLHALFLHFPFIPISLHYFIPLNLSPTSPSEVKSKSQGLALVPNPVLRWFSCLNIIVFKVS